MNVNVINHIMLENIQIMRVVNVEKENMKIKFKSNDDLLLNKILELYVLTVIIRSVLEEDAKDYS